MTDEQNQSGIQELMTYQEHLEVVLDSMSKSSFNWSIEGEREARKWMTSTLERVKAEIMKLVELKERE
ncbi:MAG TPA: hypothetical protein VE732_07970 [Nitrososphaera sp.]|jgi:hypothetical protein|nr:hypothetical protein [Nitrososphaera sp.]